MVSENLLLIKMNRKEAEELIETLKHNACHLYSNNFEKTRLMVHIVDYLEEAMKL